ncbi:zinc-dependent peptidase [Nitrospira sp. T9]|uniref:M90 family metallopeptidase n=1 Tax=unclassified Nitrospira TaxID=2652172 RepID=UPI003F9E6441
MAPLTNKPGIHQREKPHPQEHLTHVLAIIFTSIVCFLVFAILWPNQPSPLDIVIRFLGIALGGAWLYRFLTRHIRHRAMIRQAPFPTEWEKILAQHVPFYQALSLRDQNRFREVVHIFLREKRITGINTSVDDTDRVLVATSAIIPIFGFPGWEWEHIREILIYPSSFDEGYQMGSAQEHPISGMVGTGAMNRMMILSKPDLLQGFLQPSHGHNVGIHEFTHLLDKSDGTVDGVPEIALPGRAIKPWLNLVQNEMNKIRKGHSDINPYGLTNEAEFFAVVSEYFFEEPMKMKQKHPALYAMLKQIFRQDPQSRITGALKTMLRPKQASPKHGSSTIL